MLVCSSPQLIAAYHVLHRLSEPRHPPYALKCFKRVITITRYLQLLLSQYVKELSHLPPKGGEWKLLMSLTRLKAFADVKVANLVDRYVTPSCLKELFDFPSSPLGAGRLWRISESNR
jgi:hypothetical protein